MDSVEISLLTCQPHEEVYSLYGHTAIRYHDLRSSDFDLVFNYGVFDFRRPHFVARFVFGLTDYELGVYPFPFFCQEYRRVGSMVVEQVLNLSREEKLKLRNALGKNLQPENRVYRYNYFYNNCTTKARDVIEQCLDGKIEYYYRSDYTPSFRQMVSQQTAGHPWTTFGNDMLLGLFSDKQAMPRQQEFLPDNLMYDFDHAQVYAMGKYRPLVSERRLAVAPGVQVMMSGFALSPLACGALLALLGAVMGWWQIRRRRSLLVWDALLMLATGAIGIVLTLMIFSQHPTTSLNLQILLFNPLPWFFLYPVVRRRPTVYWKLTALLAALFFIGNFFQHYAVGIQGLALCLLVQCWVHIKTCKA